MESFRAALENKNARVLHMERTDVKAFTHIVVQDKALESQQIIYPDHFQWLMDNVNNLFTLGEIAPIEAEVQPTSEA